MGCAFPWLALHRGHDDGQGLAWLGGGLGVKGAAGGGVGVVGIVHRHTADHVGPLACSRAAGEFISLSFIYQVKAQSLKTGNGLTRQQGTSCHLHLQSRCGW